MGKFTWGNMESLSEARTGLDDDCMHKRLHEFWRRYYRAPYMTLAVQADQPLDTLQQWVSTDICVYCLVRLIMTHVTSVAF